MKKIIVLGCMMGMSIAGMTGCATPEIKQATQPMQSVEPDLVNLDTWLEQEVFKDVTEALQGNSFMKGVPFIIVKAKGEVVSPRIDPLTEDVRERLVSVFLEYPGIELVRRHPAPVIDRPYTLQDLKCDRYIEHKMLLTIDIRPLGRVEDNIARVYIRAIDRNKDTWIKGFSIHQKVALSPQQSRELNSPDYPDQYLRGLRYVPFTESQGDEVAAYLARNLTCIIREGYGGEDVKVFFDASKARRKYRNITWFIRKQLTFCNEIREVNDKAEADWVLEAEARETGAATGLAQFWVTAPSQRGVATYAYFLTGNVDQPPLTGRWEIRDLSSKKKQGFLEIASEGESKYRGTLFGPDGRTLQKRGIIINLRDESINWTYYDDRAEKTLEVKGVLLDDGEKMTVKVSSFPSSGKEMDWELVLVE